MKFAKGWGLLLLTLITVALAAGVFSRLTPRGGETVAVTPAAPSPAAPASAATPAELPDASVYHLEGAWQDQTGQDVQLASLRGRPQVMAMIYGGCKGACPRIINDIKTIEADVKKSHPEGVGYLLVTMDPEVDSTERLQALSQQYELGPSWRLLRGTPDQVRELAAVLGVKYRKISPTDYAHSNTISVLDAAGLIVFQKEELGSGLEDSAQAVSEALAAPASPCCAH